MDLNCKVSNFQVHIKSPMGDFGGFENCVQTWHELIDLLDQVTFQSSQSPVQLKIDWGDAKLFLTEASKRVINLEDIQSRGNFEKIGSDLEEYRQRVKDGSISEDLVIRCSVTNPSSDKKSIEYVIHLLNMIFLAVNLASPSSCNLNPTKIRSTDNNREPSEHTILLQGGLFNPGQQEKLDWPYLEAISVKKVWDWILAQNLTNVQLSTNKIQRVIFALLNACTYRTNLSPTDDLLWLAYALESLFDTPKLGISKALRDRIFLVLGSPVENLKQIKKKIDSFYDVRSAFVHGESEIPNPMFGQWEFDDPYLEQIIENGSFAAQIIVASLQKLIRENWRGFRFEENYSGISIDE